MIGAAAGFNTTLAVANDGYVWAAGRNWLGQLADGSFVQNPRFALVQDANSGAFLDLAPGQTKIPVPAGLTPKFFMQSEKSGDEALGTLGSLASLSLKSRIQPAGGSFAADAGTYQLFVAVVVPPGQRGLTSTGAPGAPVSTTTIYVKDSASTWSAYGGSAMPAYLRDVAASQVNSIALDILANTDLSGMTGAQFYVGYGTSGGEMMAAQRYRLMYVVE